MECIHSKSKQSSNFDSVQKGENPDKYASTVSRNITDGCI